MLLEHRSARMPASSSAVTISPRPWFHSWVTLCVEHDVGLDVGAGLVPDGRLGPLEVRVARATSRPSSRGSASDHSTGWPSRMNSRPPGRSSAATTCAHRRTSGSQHSAPMPGEHQVERRRARARRGAPYTSDSTNSTSAPARRASRRASASAGAEKSSPVIRAPSRASETRVGADVALQVDPAQAARCRRAAAGRSGRRALRKRGVGDEPLHARSRATPACAGARSSQLARLTSGSQAARCRSRPRALRSPRRGRSACPYRGTSSGTAARTGCAVRAGRSARSARRSRRPSRRCGSTVTGSGTPIASANICRCMPCASSTGLPADRQHQVARAQPGPVGRDCPAPPRRSARRGPSDPRAERGRAAAPGALTMPR